MICSIDKVIKTLVPINCVYCRNKSTFVNNLDFCSPIPSLQLPANLKKHVPLSQFNQVDEIYWRTMNDAYFKVLYLN